FNRALAIALDSKLPRTLEFTARRLAALDAAGTQASSLSAGEARQASSLLPADAAAPSARRTGKMPVFPAGAATPAAQPAATGNPHAEAAPIARSKSASVPNPAATLRPLDALVAALQKLDDAPRQLAILTGISAALKGQRTA